MLVTLGENGIKTVEDLADCATDELAGWQERAHGQTKQHPGILQEFRSEQVRHRAADPERAQSRRAGSSRLRPAEEHAEEPEESLAEESVGEEGEGEGGRHADGEEKAALSPSPYWILYEAASHVMEGEEGGDSIIPVRTCIVERARKERPFLLRFVLSPQDEVVPDIKGSLPGRGVWVTARKETVADAVKRRAFQRAFRKPVSVSDRPSFRSGTAF